MDVDLSDFVLANEETSNPADAQATAFPVDFVVPAGSVVIIARDCTLEEFETFWNVTLDDNVFFLISGDVNAGVPVINGSERLKLYGPTGAVEDGITVRGETGKAYRRIQPSAPNSMTSWNVVAERLATPGVPDLATTDRGIFISEWADATGSGNYAFEYVELFINP